MLNKILNTINKYNLIQKGDKIVTNGGLIGEIVKVDEDSIKVKLNDEGVTVKVAREFIAKKINEQ